jgi:N-acyl-D-aspartate/D-glutamate deacylase
MADPAFKARMLGAADGGKVRKLGGALITAFGHMYELDDPPDYEPDPSSAVGTAERAYDLLSQGDGKTLFYVPFLNYIDGGLDEVGKMLAHPFTIPGLSDGGAHVGTICDGSFPTTLLTMWARDRDHGKLDVPFIVQRQCRDTARQVGLLDRGVLAPGYRADVNVIDFDALTSRRPEIRFDLPAGGKRLIQKADGYRHTFVQGTEVYRDGEHTGALPGRLVRGGQPAPA